MTDTRAAVTAPPSVRARPGLRITLLSVAAAILLPRMSVVIHAA